MTPKAYIDHRATLEAKRLLAHTELQSSRIATGLGFTDPAVFARFFHQQTGSTPTAFRTQQR